MFYKNKDPITKAGLGIIGTIGVVLILVAGWSTFFASGPQPGGLDTAEGQAGQADDGGPPGPLPQVGDGESHESVREAIETADEELPMAPEGEGAAAQDAAGEAETVGADPEAGTDAAEAETLAGDDPPPLEVGDDAQTAQAADEGSGQAGAQEQAQSDSAAQEQAQADAGAQAQGAAAGGGAPFSEEGMALVTADAEAGARVWNQCRACHVADEEQNRVGPHLVGMVGREVASVDGFRYSDALQNLEIEHWTPEELDAWLADPRGYAPGTTMSFQGLRSPEDRANLLTWFYETQQGQ